MVNNSNKKFTLGILLTFIICIGSAIFAGYSTGPYGNYPNPGHHPGEIGPGIFNASNSTNPYWSFPGKVGIGTTNPDKILTVKRDSTSVDPATTDSVIKIINTANANDGLSGIIFSGSDWTDRAAGIFTRWGNDDARDGNILFWTGKNTGSGQEFTEKARITKDGNVGIGTDSPDEKLHVAGNAKIEEDLNVSGNTTLKATAIEGDLDVSGNIQLGNNSSDKVKAYQYCDENGANCKDASEGWGDLPEGACMWIIDGCPSGWVREINPSTGKWSKTVDKSYSVVVKSTASAEDALACCKTQWTQNMNDVKIWNKQPCAATAGAHLYAPDVPADGCSTDTGLCVGGTTNYGKAWSCLSDPITYYWCCPSE